MVFITVECNLWHIIDFQTLKRWWKIETMGNLEIENENEISFFVSFVQAIISRSLTGLLFYYVMWLRWSFDYFISCVFNSSLSSVYKWRGIDQKALELAYPEYLFTNCMYYIYCVLTVYFWCVALPFRRFGLVWFGIKYY